VRVRLSHWEIMWIYLIWRKIIQIKYFWLS
jgi:hypothetical protein